MFTGSVKISNAKRIFVSLNKLSSAKTFQRRIKNFQLTSKKQKNAQHTKFFCDTCKQGLKILHLKKIRKFTIKIFVRRAFFCFSMICIERRNFQRKKNPSLDQRNDRTLCTKIFTLSRAAFSLFPACVFLKRTYSEINLT